MIDTDNSGVVVGLDVGSYKIKCVIAKRTPNKKYGIVSASESKSRGVKNGVIVDIANLSAIISRTIIRAEKEANFSIKKVNISLPALHIRTLNLHGSIYVARNDKHITYDDVENVLEKAIFSVKLPPNLEVVDLIINEFIIDGFGHVSNPLDMVGVLLEVNIEVYVGPKTVYKNFQTAVRQAGFEVLESGLSPLLNGKLILSDEQQNNGVILIDLGANQTTTSIIKDHHMRFVSNIDQGSSNITKDLRQILASEKNIDINFEQAERLKRDFGYADPGKVDDKKIIQFNYSNTGKNKRILIKYISQIINNRVENINRIIYADLNQITDISLPRKIILIGGGASLTGISSLFEKRFNKTVHLFVPKEIGLRRPSFVNVISIIHFVMNQSVTEGLSKRTLKVKSVAKEIGHFQSNEIKESRKKFRQKGKFSKKKSFFDKIKEYYSRMFE